MRARNIYLYLTAFLIAGCLTFPSQAAYAPNQLVVKFKSGTVSLPKGLAVAAAGAANVTAASVKALNAKYQAVKFRQLHSDALAIYAQLEREGKLTPTARAIARNLENEYVLTFAGTTDVARAAKEYRQDANIDAASPNSRVRAFLTPNDPHYGVEQKASFEQIKAPTGWSRTTGDASAIIAVIDTGLNYNHEDFVNKVDLTDAKNYITGTDDPLDDYGHGTAVSGVIGAVTNNNKGVAGVDWSAKILPIKVLDSGGTGDIADVAAALSYLVAKKSAGVNIIAANMSLGQYNEAADKYIEEDPAGLKERCQEAYDAGIVLVAAAGNGNVDWNSYPACYPTVLAVAAVDSTDHRSVWGGVDPDTGQQQASNYAAWVDVSAPGTSIYTTDMNGSYSGGWNGTSLAGPFAAGLVGLVKAVFPALTSQQVIDEIKAFADDIDSLNPGYAGKLGTGRINVFRALKGLVADINAPASGAFVRGTVAISGEAGGWNFASYEVDALSGGALDTVIATSTASVESGTLAAWNTAGRNGAFTLRLRVYASDNSTLEASNDVTVDNEAPEAQITSPAAGASVQGATTVSGTARDANFDHYTVEYGAGASPASYQTVGTFYNAVTADALAAWETSGLTGLYTLRLTAVDRAGNVSSEALTVTILAAAPTKEVEPVGSLPLTYILPNPFVRSSSAGTSETTFNYSLRGNFNAVIYLFDLNGHLVWQKSYAAGENGGKAGANNPAWNGYDLFGGSVANGVYLYQITADRKVIARGKIIVLN
ncbi:MAG: S8 family peptidase [Candidatus Saganbacteria bacterium]|nr:S8 family peptidase [Candidatus Saganbacteria bacterium]